jgi:aryl carrier-like protein
MRWDATIEEVDKAARICERAEELGFNLDRIRVLKNLNACHSNGCPLDFDAFLNLPTFEFIHDFLGIDRFLDQETGKLQDGFIPRSRVTHH